MRLTQGFLSHLKVSRSGICSWPDLLHCTRREGAAADSLLFRIASLLQYLVPLIEMISQRYYSKICMLMLLLGFKL